MQLETQAASEQKIKLDPQDQELIDSILKNGPQGANPAQSAEKRSFVSRMANPLNLSFKGWMAYSFAMMLFVTFIVYQRVVPMIEAYERRAKKSGGGQPQKGGGPPKRRQRHEF